MCKIFCFSDDENDVFFSKSVENWKDLKFKEEKE